MNARRWLALLLIVVAFAAQAIDPIRFRDDAEEARFQSLAKELRCLVCQNESLADSSAGLAQDLRRDLLEQIRSGASDDDIKRYLTDRYGDFILYRPPMKPSTWALWFGPLAMLVVGAIVLLRILRRSKPAADAVPDAAADPVSGDWEA